MPLIKWTPLYEPFSDFGKAFDELSKLQLNFNPAIDMYDKDSNIIVEVALAGVKPENVKLSIEDNILNIEGHSEHKREIDESNYYRKEVRTGSFHRMVSLPSSINADAIKAEYENGILKIIMPKKEEAKPKSISINVQKKN